MINHAKLNLMIVLLPLLAACSGEDGSGPPLAPQQLDTAMAAQSVPAKPAPAPATLGFDAWANRLMEDRLSPKTPVGADMSLGWVGANGRVANVVVRVPQTQGKPTITISPPAAGADATPVFTAALATLRKSGGGTLRVAAGDYRFKSVSTEAPGMGHLLLYRLNDIDIRATGANFLFETNAYGVFIQDCERVRISGAQMRDPRPMSGTGQIQKVESGYNLVLDAPLPSGASINWVQPINQNTRTWPQTMQRTIVTPGMKQPIRIDDRTFTIPEFKNLKDWRYVSVKYEWYSPGTVYIRDSYTGVNNDITLDSIRFGSHAGLGVLIRSRGRGFALQNSSFAADPGRPYSANYDGFHVAAAAGDILIRNNSFANTGDDQINLRSIIHKVAPVSADVATISNEGRMIRLGDEVAFFDTNGEYLGKRIVSQVPPLGNSDTVTLTFGKGDPFDKAVFARAINITPRRFAVVGNTMVDSGGHGMLIQIANGLIQNNVIRNLPRTAIRLLTSFDPWSEGAGAINVRVTGNTIENGVGEMTSFATGIITAIGEVSSAKLPTNFLNGWLQIDNNKFTVPRAPCVTIYNTKQFVQDKNTCGT